MGAGEQNYFPQKSAGDGCWGLADENGFLQGMTDFFFFKLESATSHPHSPFPSPVPIEGASHPPSPADFRGRESAPDGFL